MRNNKPSKTIDSIFVSQLVTMQELNAMSDFIRNFKMKYAPKKNVPIKKKK